MGNWSDRQEAKKEEKEREKATREIIGKYFLDLSKLFLTAVSFSALAPWFLGNSSSVNWGIAIIGAISCLIFAMLGYRILKSK